MSYLHAGAHQVLQHHGEVAHINALVDTFSIDVQALNVILTELRRLRQLTFKNLACTCRLFYELWTENQEVELIFVLLSNALQF